MKIRRGTLYLADPGPERGTEAGETRPILAMQTDLLNGTGHPSTWVLPGTTRLTGENILRVPVPRGMAGNRQDRGIMMDQGRAIDNRRFVGRLKPLPPGILEEVEGKLRALAEL